MTSYRPADAQPLTSKKLRFTIQFQVIIIHCLVILGPLSYVLYLNWISPQETVFKVNLVGPLSTGEVVGPPSRLRPSSNPGPLPPVAVEPPRPTPPAPPVPAPPRPTPPAPRIPAEPPRPTPPRRPVQTNRTPPTRTPANRTRPATQPTRPAQTNTTPRRLSAEEQVALARQNAAKAGDGGGTNRNIAVPIGDADRAQTLGRQNNATPGGGGASADDKAYGAKAGNYIKTRWTQPTDALLGGTRPSVTIELAIAADGRVTSSRIVRASGNRSMDDSVQRMLVNLDRVPAPTNGAISMQFILKAVD